MAYLQLVSSSPSGVNVRIADLSFPAKDYHEFRFRVNSGSWISTGKPTNSDHNSPTISLWTGSSDCPAFVEAISFYGTGSVNFSATFYTAKQPAPTISANSSTSSSVSVSWSSVPGATDYRLNNMTTGEILTIFGTSFTWTGLNPNTSYTFRVYANVTGNCSTYTTGWSSGVTRSTLAPARPNNWSWYTAKTSGTKFNVTATEWNAFCTRINEFRTYKGLSSYSFTSAISGSNALASQINQARTAISAMSSSVPSVVSSGGNCFPSTLNGLRDSLNSIL